MAVVTALNVQWLADGFAELEGAIAAGEWELAAPLARFIDAHAEWGSLAAQRLAEAQDKRRKP